MIMMWGLSELIRFGSHLYSSFTVLPKALLWVRYSSFIVLYPIGVFSEMMILKDGYEKISQCCPRVLSYEMPNEFNISFDYLYFIWIVMIPSYIVGFPFLYTYMLEQRKKKLNKIE